MSDSFEHDDELLARLRAADPASTLPPATPDRVARLLEETMSNDVLTESRETGTRRRGPLTWLVAAAAVVVIAGAGLFFVLNGNDDPVTAADPEPTAPASTEGSVTELTAPGDTQGRCMLPSAEAMAGNEVAFDGTVRSIEGDLVTLVPTEWYAGEPTDLVTVQAPGDAMRALLVAVKFEEGGRFLLTSADGEQLMVCGFSAPFSAGLASMYTEAFRE